MKLRYIVVVLLLLSAITGAWSQRVHAIAPGITVDSLFLVKPNATKITYDASDGHLYYSTINGDIYKVIIPASGTVHDSLCYTVSDHGISFLQGLVTLDSAMFICGNVWGSTTTVGKVMKGLRHANGTTTWSAVATSVPYPSSSPGGDHGFSAVTIDPQENYLYISSGARTHVGEIRDNGGAWPGKRETPMTTRIMRFPISAAGIVLPNDSALLDASGYVFAWGTRNAYDMAWDGNGELFAIDNSGERDDPEELNWMRPGKHYGYPWKMGDDLNPLQSSPYDVNTDLLVNHNSGGYLSGWFADNPGFPVPPAGITFEDPVRNYGPDADFYRDPLTGKVKNASDEGTFISSFTSHRSPLGLTFDKDSLLAAPYQGDAFLLSFMPGGDSTGYTPLSPWGSPCPFVDPVRDLLHLKLTYDGSIDNYKMNVTRIVDGFYLTVDAELVGNKMYAIENAATGVLWRITLPQAVGISEKYEDMKVSCYPNPVTGNLRIECGGIKGKAIVSLQNSIGIAVRNYQVITDNGSIEINDLGDIPAGIYFITVTCEGKSHTAKMLKVN